MRVRVLVTAVLLLVAAIQADAPPDDTRVSNVPILSPSPELAPPPSASPPAPDSAAASAAASSATPPTAAPPTADPAAVEEVFVPLQQWKERKLQDIESRVKRAQGERRASAQRPNNGGVTQSRLSKRQLLIKELFARSCPIPDDYFSQSAPSSSPSQSAAHSHAAETAPVPSPTIKPSAPTLRTLSAAAQSKLADPSHDFPYVPILESASPDADTFSKSSSASPVPSTLIETPDAEPPAANSSPSVLQRTEPPEPLPTAATTETPSASPALPTETNAAAPLLHSIEKQVRRLRDRVHTQAATNAELSADGAKNDSAKTPPHVKPSPSPRSGVENDDEVVEAAEAPVKLTRKSFNFASEGSGAQILAFSSGATGAKNIISENKDRYMLAPCEGAGGSRWVDIELSEYVILQSVQTANYEHYSSAARKFTVLGAQQYPPGKWNVLGVFDFADTREVQTFHITGRRVSRFLRVVYSGRHGREYYCPVSIFRAFGKTLIADLKDGLDAPERESSPKMHGQATSNPAPDVPVVKGPSDAEDNMDAENTAEQQAAPEPLPSTNAAQSAAGGDETPQAATSPTTQTDHSATLSKELSSDDQILLSVVREETLAPVGGDDNILRRVARMIRLLELNQSLTNQYIDTHLARYAAALAAARAETARTQADAAAQRAAVDALAARIEAEFSQLAAAAHQRDLLLTALIIALGALLGLNLVMWAALSGARAPPPVAVIADVGDITDPNLVASPVSSPEGSASVVSEAALSASGGAATDDESIPSASTSATGASASTAGGHIVETASADGVHVEMQNVQVRKRRRRKRQSQAQAQADNSNKN